MIYAYRFRAYAASQGLTPEKALERDALEYPGGKMAGYINWTDQKWRAWLAQSNRTIRYVLSPADHEAFDAFIGGEVLRKAEEQG
jgi:hypothetical protein